MDFDNEMNIERQVQSKKQDKSHSSSSATSSQNDDGGGLSLLDDDDNGSGSAGVEFSGNRMKVDLLVHMEENFGLVPLLGIFVIGQNLREICLLNLGERNERKDPSKGKVKKHTFGGFSIL